MGSLAEANEDISPWEKVAKARHALAAGNFSVASELFAKGLEEIPPPTTESLGTAAIFVDYAISLINGRQEELKSTENAADEGSDEEEEEEEEDSDEGKSNQADSVQKGSGSEKKAEKKDVAEAGSSKDSVDTTNTGGQEEEIDDLDTAWEVLEVSRSLYERVPGKELQLINVLCREAELVALQCSYAFAIEQIDLALGVIEKNSEKLSLKVLEIKLLLLKAVYQIKLLKFADAISTLDLAMQKTAALSVPDMGFKEQLKVMKDDLVGVKLESDPEELEKLCKTVAAKLLISAEADVTVAFMPFSVEGAQNNEEREENAPVERPAAPATTRDISHLVRRKPQQQSGIAAVPIPIVRPQNRKRENELPPIPESTNEENDKPPLKKTRM